MKAKPERRARIEGELAFMVQQFANRTTNGNFTRAIDVLCRSSLFDDKVSKKITSIEREILGA